MEQADPERRERFEALFERYHGYVVAYAVRRAPGELVDDVVGETFLVAWRSLDRVPDDPLPWLYGVARRVLANDRRGRRRRGFTNGRLSGPSGAVYVYLTTPEVAAVRISSTLTILTRTDPYLPYDERIAVALVRTGDSASGMNTVVPLDSNGRPIPVRAVPSPPNNLAVYAPPGQPAPPAACEVNTSGLPHARPTYGEVVQHVDAFPQVAPGTLLSCAYTRFTYHGKTTNAAILLDARHPGAPPGPLPAATHLSRHPETVNQPASLSGIGLAVTARRVGNAWLVIETNSNLATRLEILDHIRTCVRTTGRPCA